MQFGQPCEFCNEPLAGTTEIGGAGRFVFNHGYQWKAVPSGTVTEWASWGNDLAHEVSLMFHNQPKEPKVTVAMSLDQAKVLRRLLDAAIRDAEKPPRRKLRAV